MKSSEYQYYKQPFDEYNPAQALAVPRLAEDCNLVVSIPTASGKTALAEAAFGYHLSSSGTSRVVYISPFKSIGEEKLSSWMSNGQFSKYPIGILSSDHAEDRHDAMSSRIIISTLESFDSVSRNCDSSFMESISIIVFDESHVLGIGGRGCCMESIIMRVSKENPSCRFMLISGTLSNSGEIAKWIKSLNGKRTFAIKSNWKPHKVEVNIHEESSYGGKIREAVRLATSDKNGKSIIFVHSKDMGKEIQKLLFKKHVKNAFHNASVSKSNKEKIESAFISDDSFNVLISTSTLGAGVNILSSNDREHVVIVGCSRGDEPVESHEIRQMVGRCGRSSNGVADIIADPFDVKRISDEIIDGEFIVKSAFRESCSDMAFHILPFLFRNSSACGEEDVRRWIEMTFLHFSGKTDSQKVSETIIDFLIESKAVVRIGDRLHLSNIGDISKSIYLKPEYLNSIKNNIEYVESNGLIENEYSPAFILSNIPETCYGKIRYGKKMEARMDEFVNLVPFELNSSNMFLMFLWSSIMGGIPSGNCKHMAIQLKANFPRIMVAMSRIRPDLSSFYGRMSLRVEKNIQDNLVKYIQSGCSSKKDAFEQWSSENDVIFD